MGVYILLLGLGRGQTSYPAINWREPMVLCNVIPPHLQSRLLWRAGMPPKLKSDDDASEDSTAYPGNSFNLSIHVPRISYVQLTVQRYFHYPFSPTPASLMNIAPAQCAIIPHRKPQFSHTPTWPISGIEYEGKQYRYIQHRRLIISLVLEGQVDG